MDIQMRIYVYVKDEPTVITDTTIATVVFDDSGKAARWFAERASLPDPTPTQDEKLTKARVALAELVQAARTYEEGLDSGEWTQADAEAFAKKLTEAESWLISDSHAAAVRNSKKERSNG
jgi:hypothetical protein